MKTLRAAMILLLLVAICGGHEWRAEWQPNTEPDLDGYHLYISEDGGENYYQPIPIHKDSTGFTFQAGSDVCAYLTAYDTVGNISKPSPVICKTLALTGDVDGNGEVDSFDWILVEEAIDSIEFLERWQAASDVNNDGRVDSLDVAIVRDNQGAYKMEDIR